MKKLITVILVMSLMWVLSAEELTLKQALSLARANNPELKAAAAEMKAAQKSLQSSYLSLGPSASLNYYKMLMNPGSSSAMGTLEETSSLQLSASQPIFNGGKVFLSTQIAENTFKMKKESQRSKLLEITNETEIKFYSVQSSKEMVKALEKNLEQGSTSLDIAQAKYNAGLLSNVEYLQMQSEKLSTELDLLNMHNAYELSKLDLANFIGIENSFEIEEFSFDGFESILAVINSLEPKNQQILEKKLIELAEKGNPSLLVSRIGINTAETVKLMAEGNFLPSLNLSYTYTWGNSNLVEDYSGSSTVALMASLPIFPLADNALDYQSAGYDLQSTKHTYETTQNAIILAIRSSFLNLITSAKAIESAKIGSEFAWETWHQTRERFEQGMVSANELLSIEVMVISSDNNYISARQKLLESISRLTMLLGMEDNEQLLNIINLEE